MNNSTTRTRAIIYSLVILIGLMCAMPNILPASVSKHIPDWYRSATLTLGLDLRGGSHLLFEIDSNGLLLAQNEVTANKLNTELRRGGFAIERPVVRADTIRITPKNAPETEPGYPETVARIHKLVWQAIDSETGLAPYSLHDVDDAIVLEVKPFYREAIIADAIERSLEILRNRLNESGLVEPTITRQGDSGILVQLPGVDNPQQIRKLLGTTAKLTFHWSAGGARFGDGDFMSLKDETGALMRLERQVALEGKHISDAQLGFSTESGQAVVNFRLDNEGARKFGDMTRQNIGRPLAIVLDGRIITAPVIRSVISGGSGEISGSFSTQEATDLALLLRAGALPAKLEVVEERTVGPDLGRDAIQMGLTTGIVGALLVFAFMIVAYGSWGLIACFALLTNITLMVGALTVLGATLTLPGIAGIILTIGMAVDANILINERIREETRKGRSAQAALREGFDRAYATILDSNVTTLIAVSLLFMFGSGPVRGFAVTIAIGLVTSLFTAVAITRQIMAWRVRGRSRQALAIGGLQSRIPDTSTINFMRGRKIGLIGSAILSVASVFLFFAPGLHYGVDFTGGTAIEIQAPNSSADQLRAALQPTALAASSIVEFDDAGHYLVRLPIENSAALKSEVASGDSVELLKRAVTQSLPDASFPRVEMVGPKISGQFAENTVLAILLAAGGLLSYLWIRFESHFALAATLTIALDLTKTIGFLALTGIEFNLSAVAALLALIGYSINDKVVVFDRIRENLRLNPTAPLLPLLNDSINATLTRTVCTSLTSFLALLPMAIAGGNAVTSFALPMLFGIVIGTSSSILIAAPIVYLLGQRRLQKGLAQLRPSREETDRELQMLP